MAEKSSSNQQVINVLSCALCLDRFVDPRLLPCSHTFCLACIQQLASSNHGQFNCPMRDGTVIQKDDIGSLPKNRIVGDLVEMLPHMMQATTENTKSSIQQCCECLSAPANFWCNDCQDAYCEPCCIEIHKGRKASQHQRVPIEEKPVESKRCEKHRDEKLKLWCSCETLVCTVCQASRQHKDHTAVPIDEVISDTVEELNEKFTKTQTLLNQALQKESSLINPDKSNMQSITLLFDAIRKSIDACERSLKNQVSIIEEKNNTLVDHYFTTLSNKQTILSNQNKTFQEVVATKDHARILDAKKTLTEVLKQLTDELEALKLPTRTIYRIEGLDDLKVKIDENLKHVRVIEQKPDQNYSNLVFKQNATTIAAGNGQGSNLNQLDGPHGIHVDDQQQSIYVADFNNHRIVKWKFGENNGQLVAGGNGEGNRIDQLNGPTDVIVDQNNKSLIICDKGNRRVVRWSLENQQDKQIIIQNIDCCGLMMNDNGDLFVSDFKKHEVKRWRKGEKEGTVVAGGNGQGNQLNEPTFIFIDRQDAVYVSDWDNDRVMKWVKGAKEGIVVAGGQGRGNSLNQLDHPAGLIVNEVGDVYVADSGNHRIMCWSSGSKEGRLVVGGNGQGQGSNQFNGAVGLSFDGLNNLYVADCDNNRIQRFSADKNKN